MQGISIEVVHRGTGEKVPSFWFASIHVLTSGDMSDTITQKNQGESVHLWSGNLPRYHRPAGTEYQIVRRHCAPKWNVTYTTCMTELDYTCFIMGLHLQQSDPVIQLLCNCTIYSDQGGGSSRKRSYHRGLDSQRLRKEIVIHKIKLITQE